MQLETADLPARHSELQDRPHHNESNTDRDGHDKHTLSGLDREFGMS
jgi:hypothetical protein